MCMYDIYMIIFTYLRCKCDSWISNAHVHVAKYEAPCSLILGSKQKYKFYSRIFVPEKCSCPVICMKAILNPKAEGQDLHKLTF